MRVVEGEKLPPPAAHGPAPGFHPEMLLFLFFAVMVGGGVLRAIFGRVFGAGFGGGIAALAAWAFVGSLVVAIAIGIVAFFIMLLGGFGGGPRRSGWGGGPWIGGGWGGGGFGGGG